MRVEDVYYSDFETFYKDILPNGKFGKSLTSFVFRGESSSLYKLLPSALRPENRGYLHILSGFNEDVCGSDEAFQILLEYAAMKNFYRTANSSGLYVPNVQRLMKDYNDDYCFELEKFGCKDWISDDLIEVASLAQHSGVPTRLLDWTYDFNVALYFSSRGACRRGLRNGLGSDDYIVVWALNVNYIRCSSAFLNCNPVEVVVSPYVHNGNLNFQKGLFTYTKTRFVNSYMVKNGCVNDCLMVCDSPLDDYIKSVDGNPYVVVLYRFLLPAETCHEVFSFVDRLGYHAATLFPGYAGVRQRLDEREYLWSVPAEQNF